MGACNRGISGFVEKPLDNKSFFVICVVVYLSHKDKYLRIKDRIPKLFDISRLRHIPHPNPLIPLDHKGGWGGRAASSERLGSPGDSRGFPSNPLGIFRGFRGDFALQLIDSDGSRERLRKIPGTGGA